MNHTINSNEIKATIIDIKWERIFLSLYVSFDISQRDNLSPEKLDYYAVDESGLAGTKFQVISKDNNTVILRTNVTNNGTNQCIPKGIYNIYVCEGNKVLTKCVTDPSIVSKLPDMSRGFLYFGLSNAYNVNFYIEDVSNQLPFRMCIANSANANMNFACNKNIADRLKSAFVEYFFKARPIIRRLYSFYSILGKHKRKKTVLFMTEHSKSIGSNLKAVSDRMLERDLDKTYRMIYSSRVVTAPEPRLKRLMNWFSVIKKLAESGVVFLDDHASILDWLKLDDDTKVIQLWHAGAGFKSSGYSRWGHMFCPAPNSCHRQYSYGISGSHLIAPFFSEVWGINDELVLPTGMPRMDKYLKEDYREKKTKELYEKYPMCKGKKVILFAPTYRGDNIKDAHYPYELLDLDKLYDLCGDEYVVLFKMHPWIVKDVPVEKKHQDKFISVLKYPDINDLFYITDLLITDYSSNIFEFSIMKKPMLFFAFDKIQYSVSRGFHRDYEEAAPGKVCYSFHELLEAIKNQDFEFEKVEQYVKHHFDYIDSNASDRVIDWLLLDNMPENLKKNIIDKENEVQAMLNLRF